MTDPYRAMCAEIVDALDSGISAARIRLSPLADRARALLDQPEPKGPTDEELDKLYFYIDARHVASWRHYARAVLAKWDNSQGILDSSPQPVPVSERLPKPEDCNGDGEVWAWRRFDSEDMDNGDFWCLAFCEWLEDEDCNFTHWLPANAIPTPDATND